MPHSSTYLKQVPKAQSYELPNYYIYEWTINWIYVILASFACLAKINIFFFVKERLSTNWETTTCVVLWLMGHQTLILIILFSHQFKWFWAHFHYSNFRRGLCAPSGDWHQCETCSIFFFFLRCNASHTGTYGVMAYARPCWRTMCASVVVHGVFTHCILIYRKWSVICMRIYYSLPHTLGIVFNFIIFLSFINMVSATKESHTHTHTAHAVGAFLVRLTLSYRSVHRISIPISASFVVGFFSVF